MLLHKCAKSKPVASVVVDDVNEVEPVAVVVEFVVGDSLAGYGDRVSVDGHYYDSSRNSRKPSAATSTWLFGIEHEPAASPEL